MAAGSSTSLSHHPAAPRPAAQTTWRLLVTPREACEALASVPAALLGRVEIRSTGGRIEDGARLLELLRDRDAVVLDLERITAGMLVRCPTLRVISRFGEGCDAIDLEAARAHGVRVTRTRGVAASAVARHAVALMLAVTHRLIEHDRALKQGQWSRRPNWPDRALVIGVVGCGMIGSQVAALASAIGWDVVVYHRRPGATPYRAAATLEELLCACDMVTLHLPLTEETRGILSASRLRQMQGKVLVNTARGGLVDEAAVLRALEAGTLEAYATDVFAHEPPMGISKALAEHPHVIATPHLAALDAATAFRMTVRAIENAVHGLEGADTHVNAYVV